ncbi:MAG: hypothetical protein ACPKPY_01540, partial [Nitrososphaeraceae archaeon]
MTKKLHPTVYKQINKMYKWYYENNDEKLNILFEYLDLDHVSFDKLEKKLYDLSFDKILVLLRDLITTSEFWLAESDIRKKSNYETELRNYNKQFSSLNALT